LSGPAAEAAARAPEQNLVLQGKLQSVGSIPKDGSIDGVFATGTRTAVLSCKIPTGSLRQATSAMWMPPLGFPLACSATLATGIPVFLEVRLAFPKALIAHRGRRRMG
jgi:hypothetical protein